MIGKIDWLGNLTEGGIELVAGSEHAATVRVDDGIVAGRESAVAVPRCTRWLCPVNQHAGKRQLRHCDWAN